MTLVGSPAASSARMRATVAGASGPTRPGHADELRRLLMDLVEPSRGHEGSLQYHLHEQEDGFMDELPAHLKGAPEAYFGVLRSPYPTVGA
ncbi:antibiotic biosynthesis monooxygenase [Actinoallomurus sp. NPDC052308]|uniref:putative quinol monooxygenase n=1 Tax=Actinoallomurus sp. NPDC052308 TaxID=3155530 RepID=UPI003420B166